MSLYESLPNPSEDRVTHNPVADDELHAINPAFLRLEADALVGMRGAGFAGGMFGGVMFGGIIIPQLVIDFLIGKNLFEPTLDAWAFLAVCFAFPGFFFLLAYLFARAKLAPPVIVSRRTRKIYAWSPSKRWVALNYDHLVASITSHRIVNVGGAFTVYRLFLEQPVKTDAPSNELSLPIGSPASHPAMCGELWEFIRRYMDGPAEALPPVRLRLPTGTAWKVSSDRDFPCIDENHRVKGGVGGWIWALTLGMVAYQVDWAAAWIARTAPRHAFASQVQAAMQWQGPNPYRIKPLTREQQLALEGKLPQMRWRWFASGVLSTVAVGGLLWLSVVEMTLLSWKETSKKLTDTPPASSAQPSPPAVSDQ